MGQGLQPGTGVLSCLMRLAYLAAFKDSLKCSTVGCNVATKRHNVDGVRLQQRKQQ